MAIEVRPVRPEEFETLGRITVAAYRALGDGAVDRGYDAVLADVAARAAGAVVLAAVAGGEVVGGVTYVPGPGGPYAEFEDSEAAGIRMLAVDPARRGRGAGAALLDACVARARASGKRRVVLHSTPAMTVAHGMYRRRGFRRAPALDHQVEGLHLLAFVLDLEPAPGPARTGGAPP